ncbi:NUDIX domain-containing protein [Bacillus suaedae]|uniref:NUDIX domain-containing protein n=1 Tax=Halalkalibacter suaedae TaxID=2822140 RepID=A0A940WWH0_9BACI|nr:NUDIX domain-containing protein [Bacillus suaedae]MBP3951772.1 NUDIX domain-containing protein [Bacillus suaedae]
MNTYKNLIKVTAYITRVKDGKVQLLVMLEEGMESYGLQVPGGTLERGEGLEDCLLREIYEEAELTKLKIKSYLWEHQYTLEEKKTNITRHYFHLVLEDCQDHFTVVVRSQDEDNGWIYHYEWIDLDRATIPELGGHLGFGLRKLYDSLFNLNSVEPD